MKIGHYNRFWNWNVCESNFENYYSDEWKYTYDTEL